MSFRILTGEPHTLEILPVWASQGNENRGRSVGIGIGIGVEVKGTACKLYALGISVEGMDWFSYAGSSVGCSLCIFRLLFEMATSEMR